MNIKDFLTNRESPPEHFWSLVLEPGWVQAGLWYIKDDIAEVVSVGPASPWNNEEDLITASDAALSSTIQKLSDDGVEPTKTVFGVSSAWVKGGEIKEEFLVTIKKVCTKLSLNPVGFVVLPEAIAHLYKSEEGSPVSAIILGLGKEFLELSVFQLGNLIGTTQVAKSVSLVDDVTEGLSRFENAAPMPSRFIVYDGREGEVEEAKDTLSEASWSDVTTKSVKFLHAPKVEMLTVDRKVLAVSLAGANEIGNALHVIKKEETVDTLPKEEDVNVSEPLNTKLASELGFVVGKDVSESLPKVMPSVEYIQPNYLAKTKSMLQNLFFSGGRNKLAILLASVAGLLILGFAAWWFMPTATVSIYVAPRQFSQDSEIVISTDGTNDLANGIIAGNVLSSKASGEKNAKTTGSKQVGDKSKGSVNIRNGTANSINLSQGALVVSSGDLGFTLDSSASVSAALSPSSPGTSTVSVTASSIGAEYNLAKDETFKVGNFSKSVVDAVSIADFSGGSSRQISAVSKEDQTNLEKSLMEELSQKTVNDMGGQTSEDELLAGEAVSITKSSDLFSAKVGDEAENLKLSLDVTAKGVTVDRVKLLEYAKIILKDKVPGGYILRDDQIGFEFEFLSEDGDEFKFKVGFSANFLPQIKSDEIVAKIAGRTPEVVENYLIGVAGYSRAEITIKPKLPSFLKVLPHVKKNINLEISADR